MARKFIQAMRLKKNALHKELGVPVGKKIGAARMAKAEAPLEKKVEKGEKLTAAERRKKRRIDVAQTLSKLRRKKSRAGA